MFISPQQKSLINTNNFDFLRLLLAFIVIFSHLGVLAPNDYFDFFDYLPGVLAIKGFFVISGFLVTNSLANVKSIKTYFIKRLRRLLPPYVFLILFCAITFVFISEYSAVEYFTNNQLYQYLFANLIFQNYIEPCLPGVFVQNNLVCAVNGSLWTIKVEEGFYLLLPFMAWFSFRYIKKFDLICIAIYFLAIIYINFFTFYHVNPRLAKQLPGAMAFIFSGVFVYQNFLFFLKYKHWLFIISVLLFFLEIRFIKFTLLHPFFFSIIIIYLAYFTKLFTNFGKYGDFTYGLYIIHFPIIQIAVHLNLFNRYNPFFIGLIVVILICILSVLSWHFIEAPFLDKSRLKRYKEI